jgi:hypothetical protein
MKQPTRKPKERKHSPGPFVLGRVAFAKVSAVEGIHPTQAMEEEFREYDRKGLPAEERRRLISRKYANVR